MRKKFDNSSLRFFKITAFVAFILLALLITIKLIGFRYNLTPSMQTGLYLIKKDQVPMTGRIGFYCPPLEGKAPKFLIPGDCENGNAPQIKRIVAGPGDIVEVRPEAVFINGIELKGSKPVVRVDLPRIYGVYKLNKNQFWGYGEGEPEKSFDSRYYGVIPGDSIQVLKYIG